jgi:hypothetical protein
MDISGEEDGDSDSDSSLESNSHRANDQLENLHGQLLSLGLPDDFGALIDEIKDHYSDISDESSCDTKRHHKLLTVSDAPRDVIETIIYHRGRRNRPCPCLSNYTTSHGGTYSMDLLVQLIIESRDFVRAEDRGITDCVRNLIRRKCTHNHRGYLCHQTTCLFLGCKHEHTNMSKSLSYLICIGCRDKKGKSVSREPLPVCEVAFRLTYCISRHALEMFRQDMNRVGQPLCSC